MILIGSALNIASQMAPLFHQLGIYEQFLEISRYSRYMHGARDDGQPLAPLDFVAMEELYAPPNASLLPSIFFPFPSITHMLMASCSFTILNDIQRRLPKSYRLTPVAV